MSSLAVLVGVMVGVTYTTSPSSSSLAATSIIANYVLEDKGLSTIAGGHCEGNIQSHSRSVKLLILRTLRLWVKAVYWWLGRYFCKQSSN